MRTSKLVRILLALTLIFNCFCFVSCANKAEDKRVDEYLGQYDYSSSVSALVYEQIEGEEEGFYGIQYRVVTDLDGLLNQDDIAVCLFFYSSVVTSTTAITPGVEDLAQTLSGRVLFVAVDAFQEADLSTAYNIEAYPDFVLVKGGNVLSNFGSANYEYWGVEDLTIWMSSNGYAPDYSLLDA